jgi:hypothetical protein
MPWVRAVLPEDMEELRRELAADKHVLPHPTHVVLKDGQIGGAFSVGAVTLLMAWAHTERANGRSSLTTLNLVENLVSCAVGPGRTIAVPISPGSPFEPHMGLLGFQDLGMVRLWLKQVR